MPSPCSAGRFFLPSCLVRRCCDAVTSSCQLLIRQLLQQVFHSCCCMVSCPPCTCLLAYTVWGLFLQPAVAWAAQQLSTCCKQSLPRLHSGFLLAASKVYRGLMQTLSQMRWCQQPTARWLPHTCSAPPAALLATFTAAQPPPACSPASSR